MPANIIVVTPYESFGELIRSFLEDTGQYKVGLFLSGKSALDFARQRKYQLAILDSAISDLPFLDLCKEIKKLQKGIRLAIIPPENNKNHPSLGGLLPHGYIDRPFYAPNLLKTVSQILGDQMEDEFEQVPLPSDQHKLMSENISMQISLDQAIKNSRAIAGLIGFIGTSPEKNNLIAWAGRITHEVAEDLLEVVFRYWSQDEPVDIMRFIRLPEKKIDFQIYATSMIGGYILVLAFDSKEPLSLIRPQTKDIAQKITSISTEAKDHIDLTTDPAPVAFYHPEKVDDNLWLPENNESIDGLMRKFLPPTEANVNVPTPSETKFESALKDDDDEGDVPSISTLLEAFPPPDPNLNAQPKRQSESEHFTITDNPESEWHNWQEAFDPQSVPPLTDLPVAESAISIPAATSEEFLKNEDIEEYFLNSEFPSNDIEDTRPNVVTSFTNISQLEPISPGLSQINYTCVLVPRLPQHYLTGGLADHLAHWVHQLCLAYGWRLEGISVRPEYLQWTVQVAPSISPGNLVRIIRQRSSEHIFNKYLQLRTQNPSGDFWASGYLIVSGNQPPSAQLLREYIVQTRKRQGILK